jgi:hypothetical protein
MLLTLTVTNFDVCFAISFMESSAREQSTILDYYKDAYRVNTPSHYRSSSHPAFNSFSRCAASHKQDSKKLMIDTTDP